MVAAHGSAPAPARFSPLLKAAGWGSRRRAGLNPGQSKLGAAMWGGVNAGGYLVVEAAFDR